MPQQTAPSHGNPQIIEGLPPHQQIVAVVLSLVMLVVVIELIRKRKLREEYSILWVVTAGGLLALALEASLLTMFQRAVGAVLPTSALFFGALIFLMLVSLQYSVRLSKLTARNKNLCQKMALLERDLDDLRHELRSGTQPQSGLNKTVTIPRPDPQSPAPESATGQSAAQRTTPSKPETR